MWVRIEDRQKEWDLMQAGLLWSRSGIDDYYHYSTNVVAAWQKEYNKKYWFSPDNWRENYILLED